ncbi:hypothetical protein F5887DRAFT_925247 [Amanita rubescens]|nr:hypothetical protein F5887DRAFT_925247 [Amanita rubescens]
MYDLHPQMRVAFVTYGPGDMPHSPLLCKRFFVDHQLVFKEMKDSPGKLGFGQANTGGDKGMAALEAHIAALETRKGRMASNFVIHVAAFPPDASQYPRWNESASLDRTTWDSLPSEYQKRNVTYNVITLNGRIHQFSSLHSALQQSRTESKPWFSVRAPHMVLLTGIPMLEEPKTTPAKRASDLDKTPESKRPRLSSNKPEASPPQPSGIGSAQQSHIEPSQRTSNAQGAAQHTIAVLNTKMHSLEDKIRGLEANISEARRAGNTQMVEKLSSDWKQQKDFLANFHRRLYEFMQSSSALQAAGNKPTVADPLPSQQDPSSSLQQKSGKEKAAPHSQNLDFHTTHPHSSDGIEVEVGQSAVPEIPYKAPINPVLEQERRMRQMQGATGQMVQVQNAIPGHLRPQPAANLQRGQQTTNTFPVWQGQLIWNGVGSTGKKECRAKVVALSQNVAECRADTWPSIMTLVPTPEPTASLQELKEWIMRFKPVICRFQHQPESADPTNEQYYASLIQLLTTRKVFAVAGWTLPSGGQENNILVFPVSNQSLLGAVFPVTGIPEMPKPLPAAPSTGSLNSAQVLAQLQRLPPEQRDYLIGRLLQRSNPHSMAGMSGCMSASQPHMNTDRLGPNTVGMALNGNSSMGAVQSVGVGQQGGYSGGHDEVTASQVMSSLTQAQIDNQLSYS